MLLLLVTICINYNYLPGIHGIGHGLSMIFGTEEIEKALNICQMHSDSQFQYSCATGIFMSLIQEYDTLSGTPCDSLHFPAACFRFKTNFFRRRKGQDLCLTQIDEYHTVGCIWGHAYSQHDYKCTSLVPVKGSKNYERDEIRHAACIDGTFSSTGYDRLLENRDMCGGIRDFPLSYEICEKRTKNSFQTFTFTNESDYYYNTQILEKDFL